VVGQLNLFGGKRQRGRRVAPPKEFLLHVSLAKILKVSMMPGWRYTHLPFGEYRDPITAGRLKAMGVTPGWPDFMFTGVRPPRIFWLELKRQGMGLNDNQKIVRDHLMDCGFMYLCTPSVDDAVGELKANGIVRAEVQ
jgi:hypothetical protein